MIPESDDARGGQGKTPQEKLTTPETGPQTGRKLIEERRRGGCTQCRRSGLYEGGLNLYHR